MAARWAVDDRGFLAESVYAGAEAFAAQGSLGSFHCAVTRDEHLAIREDVFDFGGVIAVIY